MRLDFTFFFPFFLPGPIFFLESLRFRVKVSKLLTNLSLSHFTFTTNRRKSQFVRSNSKIPEKIYVTKFSFSCIAAERTRSRCKEESWTGKDMPILIT